MDQEDVKKEHSREDGDQGPLEDAVGVSGIEPDPKGSEEGMNRGKTGGVEFVHDRKQGILPEGKGAGDIRLFRSIGRRSE